MVPVERPRPMCFLAMPFGRKAPPGRDIPVIDFDRIRTFMERAVKKNQLECIRADFEQLGGFIHRPMFERLMVAEYVVADLTFANPNVAYEVGVRHGSGANATILTCAANLVKELPFDFGPLRVLTYRIADDGSMSDDDGDRFASELAEKLSLAVRNQLPTDNPILQLTSVSVTRRVEHEKTDVFMDRIRFADEVSQRIRAATRKGKSGDATAALTAIAEELLCEQVVVAQLHTALLAVYLGLRDHEGFEQMVALYDRLPPDLQRTSIAIEQLALALNRIAETAAKSGQRDRAAEHRLRAIDELEKIPAEEWTSETFGIAGRIYKGQWATAAEDDKDKPAALDEAIRMYENGFLRDLNDYYPGVNAVTLRLTRAREEDLKRVPALAHAVRLAAESASAASNDEERYFQAATKLELDCAARDWELARKSLEQLPLATTKPLWRKSTAKNLEMQRRAFADDPTAAGELDQIIARVAP